MLDALRQVKRFGPRRVELSEDGDGETDRRGRTPLEHALLDEVVREYRACLRAIRSADRRGALVWCFLLEMPAGVVAEVWGKTPESVRQVCSRAAREFRDLWARGPGATLAEAVEQVLEGTTTMADPDRIRDPRARKAYRA